MLQQVAVSHRRIPIGSAIIGADFPRKGGLWIRLRRACRRNFKRCIAVSERSRRSIVAEILPSNRSFGAQHNSVRVRRSWPLLISGNVLFASGKLRIHSSARLPLGVLLHLNIANSAPQNFRPTRREVEIQGVTVMHNLEREVEAIQDKSGSTSPQVS